MGKPRYPEGMFHGGDMYSYRALAERIPEGGTLVELGTFRGRSLCSIAAIILARGLNVHGVDMFIKLAPKKIGDPALLDVPLEDRPEGLGIRDDLSANLAAFGIGNHVRVHTMDTVKAAALFADGTVDAVFHDANHTREGVTRDLHAWWPKVKVGGLFAGHDYSRRSSGCDITGVREACDAFFGGVRKNEVQRQTTVWHVEKLEDDPRAWLRQHGA